MRVNDRQRVILTGVLADQRRLANQDVGQFEGLTRQQRGRDRLRVAEAKAGLVPIDLDGWLGRAPTNSERVMFHREYGRLEEMGLIERRNLHGGRRTTHLRLTAAGRQLAEGLLEPVEATDAPDASEALDAFVFLPIELPPDDEI